MSSVPAYSHHQVERRRALSTAVGAALLGAALAAMPVERPTTWSLPGLEAWVAQRGPVALAIVLLQASAVVVAAALTVAGMTAGLADRSATADRLTRLLAPSAVRRWWAGGALAVAITTAAAPVGAVEAVDGSRSPMPVMIDLGPAPTNVAEPVLLRDLGPTTIASRSAPTPSDIALVSPTVETTGAVAEHLGGETWPVQPGDHLWHIAESTLADRGQATDEMAVLAYWQQLIEANQMLLGSDVDLIHPGEVIHLPATATAGS